MSHFAKRHYEAIALAMQDVYPCSVELDRHGVDHAEAKREHWAATVHRFVDLFTADNNAFDRSRFERACQPGANVRACS